MFINTRMYMYIYLYITGKMNAFPYYNVDNDHQTIPKLMNSLVIILVNFKVFTSLLS